MPTKTSTTFYRYKDIVSDVTPEVVTNRSRTLYAERTGVEMLDYKQRIIDRKNATTPLTAFRDTVSTAQQLRATGVYGTSYQRPAYIQGLFVGDPQGLTIEMTANERKQLGDEAKALARTYAFRRIQKYQDPFNGARETLGELKETILLLRHPLHTMANVTKSFAGLIERNRRHGPKSDRAIRASGEAWLEYNFAVAPLIKSIADIREQILYDRLDDFHIKQRVFVGDEAVQKTSTSVSPSNALGGYWNCSKEVTVVKRAECFIHFGMLFDKLLSHEQLIYNMDDTLLDVQTIPSLAWELTPLSVFVDYVVNVGDIISGAMTSQSAISYASETVVYTTETRIKTWNPNSPYSSGVKDIKTLQTGLFTLKRRRIERVGGSIGIPPMIFSLPGSNIKYMNIAALVASVNFGPKQPYVRVRPELYFKDKTYKARPDRYQPKKRKNRS